MTDNRLFILKAILVYLVFQNFIAICLSNMNVFYGKTAILAKDMVLYLGIVIYMLSSAIRKDRLKGPLLINKNNPIDKIIYFYLAVLAVYFVLPVGNAYIFAKSISLRQLLIIPVFYMIGKLFKGVDLNSVNKFIVKLGIIICLFSVVERFFLGDSFWKSMGMYNYMKAKGFAQWANSEGISESFYTFDYIPFIKYGYGSIRRMVGIHADSLLTAQFLAYPALLLYSRLNPLRRPISTIGFLLCFVVILLTFSKGGILILFISIITIAVFTYGILSRAKLIWLIIALMGPASMAAALLKYNIGSVMAHLTGLTSNIAGLLHEPFGFGIGVLGNYARMITGKNPARYAGSGESYLGTMIGQIGIFAVIYFLFLVYQIYQNIGKKHTKDHRLILIVVFAVLCTATLSESAITYTGTGYLFLLLGLISDSMLEPDRTEVSA